MKNLQVGDYVLTRTGNYQPVYAFAHWDSSRYTEYLQIHTSRLNHRDDENSHIIMNHHNITMVSSPLELTQDHLVYIQGEDKPVPAGAVKVGDILQGVAFASDFNPSHAPRQKLQHRHEKQEQLIRQLVVTDIQAVTRNGLYNPLTQVRK